MLLFALSLCAVIYTDKEVGDVASVGIGYIYIYMCVHVVHSHEMCYCLLCSLCARNAHEEMCCCMCIHVFMICIVVDHLHCKWSLSVCAETVYLQRDGLYGVYIVC